MEKEVRKVSVQITTDIRDKLNKVVSFEQSNEKLINITQAYVINKLLDEYINNNKL